jgi:hypothetical protein
MVMRAEGKNSRHVVELRIDGRRFDAWYVSLPAGHWSRAILGTVDPSGRKLVRAVAAATERWLHKQAWSAGR